MCAYAQFSFWISVAPDMIYLSYIHYLGKNTPHLVGTFLRPV